MANPGDMIGHYVVESVLGTGGMGTVYAARDARLERPVALKVISAPKAATHTGRARFAQEARALARISDPHVVQIYDFAPDHNPPFLVMEQVSGRSLRQLIQAHGLQPIARVLDAALQSLSGLIVAHRAGIIHRDIKPSNILLADNGTYKLVDFGLARGALDEEMEASLTASDCVVGTPSYMAPECACGEEAGERADLYSLGVTLLHMASGEKPYAGANALDIISRIIKPPVEPLSNRLPSMPAILRRWFDRMLAHDPLNRFASADEAYQALDRIADEVLAICAGRAGPSTADSERAHSTDTLATGTGHGGSQTVETMRPQSQGLGVPSTEVRRRRRSRAFGFYLRLLSAIWLISSVGTFFAIAIISEDAFQEQMASLKRHMKTTVHALARSIDGDLHQRIAVRQDQHHVDYLQLVAELEGFQRVNEDIHRIYTMAPGQRTTSHGILIAVCDVFYELDRNHNGTIDPAESKRAPGDRYNARAHKPRMLDGLNEITTDEGITLDQWGAFLSAYAPIRNSLGEVIGLVAIDISGDKIVAMRESNRARAWIVLGISLLAFLAAAGLVAGRLNQPIAELKRGIREAADGNYDAQVVIRGHNEFRELGECINAMLGGLRQRDTLRRAFEHYVAREIHEHLGGAHSSQASSASDEGHAQVQLYCAVQRERHSLPISPDNERDLAGLIGTVFDFGGIASQQYGNGIVAVFRNRANLEEQAIRAALAIQQQRAQGMSSLNLVIAIDQGRDRRQLRQLVDTATALGVDIIATAEVFHPARLMFYADRYQDLGKERNGDQTETVFAIKGAVSG